MGRRKQPELGKELKEHLESYSKQLRVITETLHAMLEAEIVKGKDTVIVRRIERVRKENDNTIRRLRDPIGDDLDYLWNIRRMKAAYYWCIRDFLEMTEIFERLGNDSYFKQALDNYNDSTFGPWSSKMVLPFTFPGEFRTHLFLMMNYLAAVAEGSKAHRQFARFLNWLNGEHPSLKSVKGLRNVADGLIDDEVIIEKVQGYEEIDGKKTPVKLYLSGSFLVFKICSRIPIFSSPETYLEKIYMFEVARTDRDHKHQLVFESPLFETLPRVIFVKDEKDRDDFYFAFKELRDK